MNSVSIKDKKGFTLVEFLIATIILSVGLLALINLQWMAIRGNHDSKEMTRAIFLGEKKIEEFKNTPYSSSSLVNVTNKTDNNNPMNGLGEPGGIFYRSWTIQNYAASTLMKQITVNVSWTLKGQNHNATFQTVVSR
jgi:type IV pilus assembly protein PilV